MTTGPVVVTAADSRYFGSLMHMLGSLFARAGRVQTILVYDLGLSLAERFIIGSISGVMLRRVPPFCPHYREVENFAWKTAAICDALNDGGTVLWLDAGIEIQASLDDLFRTIDHDGYLFTVTPLDYPNCRIGNLSHSRSLELLEADNALIRNSFMVNAGVMGYKAGHPVAALAFAAREYAANPEIIRGPRHSHRHDQTIYSVLRVKHSLPAQYNIFHLENVNPRFPFLVRTTGQETIPAKVAAAWTPDGLHIYLLITRDSLAFGGTANLPFRAFSWLARFLLFAMAGTTRVITRLRPRYRSAKAAARRLLAVPRMGPRQ
jgi:hypothetical protein